MNFENINNNRKAKKSVMLSEIIYGKVPPHAKDLEGAILGAMMLDNESIFDARNILKASDFYITAHQIIFAAISEMSDSGQKIDTLTLADFISKRNELEVIGGPYYLTQLTIQVVSSAHIVSHSRIVKQYSVARKMIMFCGQVIQDSYDSRDPLQTLREAEELFFEVNKEIEQTRMVSTDDIAMRLAKKFILPDGLTQEQRSSQYLYTGMPGWDRINGPLFDGGVYTIAARPAMGKTAFAIQLLVNMSRKVPVGLINVEMTDEQLGKRIISNIMEFDNLIYKRERDDWSEDQRKRFYIGLQTFTALDLHIESEITEIDRIIQKIKFWVKKFGVRLVVIDYLQILKVADEVGKYMTETQALNDILEKIRACAKELSIPIILLSQLNRELYRRAGNKEPNMGDLKGSGKIEEISFQISFLHRPEYYDKNATVDEMGESIKGLCYQIVEKHRDGIVDRVKHRFVPEFTQFREWESEITAWRAVDDGPDDTPF